MTNLFWYKVYLYYHYRLALDKNKIYNVLMYRLKPTEEILLQSCLTGSTTKANKTYREVMTHQDGDDHVLHRIYFLTNLQQMPVHRLSASGHVFVRHLLV